MRFHPVVILAQISPGSRQANRIREQRGIGNQIDLFFVVQSGVAKINSNNRTFETGDGDVVAPSERVVEENENAGQQIRERIPERKSQGESSQSQSSYKRGDIDTQRTQSRHGSENEQADLSDLANEIQNILLRWIVSFSQLTEDAPDKAASQPESTEDQQTGTQLRAEERGFFGQFIHCRFSGA